MRVSVLKCLVFFVATLTSVMAGQAQAEPATDQTPTEKQTKDCPKTDSKATSSSHSKCRKNQASTKSESNQSTTNKDESLTDVEKKAEEARLKVLFVDVNTVVEKLGSTMDWTANWLDGYFAEDDEGKNKAKTWGHFTLGWEPRDGEWSNFPVKFKIKAKLPNLKNRVELILSDNEEEDFKTLPYETVRPDAYKSSQRSLGAAVQFLHKSTETMRTSSRLGWAESQMYIRSQVRYRKKYLDKKVTVNIQPAIEYYFSDGWGARFLFDTGYEINPAHEVRLNYSLQDRESFDSPEWRTGLYSISALSEKSALIIGASSVGVVEPEYVPEFHKFSVRYRRKAIRSWIFFEAEPFVQFARELVPNPTTGGEDYTNFERDIGIAFRLEIHYGFL